MLPREKALQRLNFFPSANIFLFTFAVQCSLIFATAEALLGQIFRFVPLSALMGPKNETKNSNAVCMNQTFVGLFAFSPFVQLCFFCFCGIQWNQWLWRCWIEITFILIVFCLTLLISSQVESIKNAEIFIEICRNMLSFHIKIICLSPCLLKYL